ncbi:hypothetical protein R9X47_05725 [Wukongibacter baidiensis]|uniref:hypothetical protein n=1 Tax=Wukongibacter baidiensis TaxID=1723361 RepID=UPI003D7F6712
MVTGHFTTALVPYSKNKEYPLFLLLIIVQIQDLLIPLDLITQKLGISELSSLQMTYSHDIIPAAIMAILVGIIMYIIYKDRNLALWSLGLVVFHEICDLFSGFSHNIFGTDTMSIGFDFYRTAPMNAYIIEFLLAVVCLSYFVIQRKKDNDPISMKKLILLSSVIFLPIIGMMINAA